MKNKIVSLLLFLVFGGTVLNAQNQVTGEVYALGMNPLADVNVMLLRPDSTVVAGCASDSLGCFAFSSVERGDWLLSFSCLGYQSRVLAFRIEDHFNVGRIVLDTLEHRLEEVEVLSKSVVLEKDRKIYYPTQEQLKYSTNGLTLLQRLSVPFLVVNLVSNEVESINGSVGMAINGKSVEMSEVLALRPEEILRVESIDYPGIRYGNVVLAINYVTKIKESGGLVGVELMGYPSGYNVSNNFFLKKNHGKSEFGLLYSNGFADRNVMEQQMLIYRFPDRTIERTGKSEENPWVNNSNNIKLNYNNRERNKYFFSSTLSGNIRNNPGRTSVYSYQENGEDAPLSVRDSFGQKLKNSSLDLYLERQFKGDQTLVFNLVGSYHDSRLENIMKYEQNDELLNLLNSTRKGEKYSLIGEVNYEKQGAQTTSTLTLKHQWHNANNDYLFLNQENRLNQHITEGGFLTMTNLNSWMIVLMGQLRRMQVSEGALSKTKWEYILHGECLYRFSDQEGIVYAIESVSNAPTLSQMDDSEYFVNDRIAVQGNFDLKTAQHVRNRLAMQFEYGSLNINLQAEHIYLWDQISYVTKRETDSFVYKWDNQGYKQDFNLDYWMQWRIIENYLSVNSSISYSNVISQGKNYKHKASFIDYQFDISGMYKNWMLVFFMAKINNKLSGEIRDYGKKEDYLFLTYKCQNLSLGGGIYCFLDPNYKANRRKVCNEWVSSHRWSTDAKNLLVFKLSYYFPWGKQKEGYKQRIKNVDSDNGIKTK